MRTLANAGLIIQAVIRNDRLDRILASKPADHEMRRLQWLKEYRISR